MKNKYKKLYPNDLKILNHLSALPQRVVWLNRNEFSMNEKTFWGRITHLEKGGYINVIRHAGLKNLYSLTDKGHSVTQTRAQDALFL